MVFLIGNRYTTQPRYAYDVGEIRQNGRFGRRSRFLNPGIQGVRSAREILRFPGSFVVHHCVVLRGDTQIPLGLSGYCFEAVLLGWL